ncbi:pyridoxamine 5'-phosphate oxidase [Pontibacter vulgaris]|uniref:pyridoxamine 5'-phosphate oxidase n=1 Tax=Pontibacter vulgaris TaxID=2905679 RepID=UPI001FA80C48|nr:pyridoxamine 5'-phosphate oxidase [Pontibacter vulgaris]
MSLTHNIADIRKNYSRQALSEDSVAQDPIEQFKLWLQEAIQAQVNEPTAMVLSTVKEGRPDARVVLLKNVAEDGFTFFTNYSSSKGRALSQNPFAALTFFWPELERQVRVQGKVVQVPAQVSDNYFHSRPVESQIGAWASPQSQPIASRSELEEAELNYKQQFQDLEQIPRPPHWGGYQLVPDSIEFWQGRPSRLHDRILYEMESNIWHCKRLAP